MNSFERTTYVIDYLRETDFVEELFCQFTYKVSGIIYQYIDNSVKKTYTRM